MRTTSKNILPALLLCFALMNGLFAQTRKIDSLRKVLATAKKDSNYINALNDLGWELRVTKNDTAILLTLKAATAARETGWQKGLANSCRNLGILYRMAGNYLLSLQNYDEALSVYRQLNDSVGIARVIGNIGTVYEEKGDFPKALDYFFKALALAEKSGNVQLQASMLGNIGIVYQQQGNFKASLEYQLKTLELARRTGNKFLEANTLGNVGGTYCALNNFPEALQCEMRSVAIAAAISDLHLQASSLGNIGIIYTQMNDLQKALKYELQENTIYVQLNDKVGLAHSTCNLGSTYLDMGEYDKAKEFLGKGLALSTESGALQGISDCRQLLSGLYERQGNFKEALEQYKAFIVARDSMFSEENTKKTVQSQMQYEFDKKETAAKAEQEKKDAVAAAEGHRQKIILFSVIACLLLVAVFALFIFRSYREKQRANVEITRQKEIIEEKQKEILDSIYYARRIQRSLLPAEKYVERALLKNNTPKKPT